VDKLIVLVGCGRVRVRRKKPLAVAWVTYEKAVRETVRSLLVAKRKTDVRKLGALKNPMGGHSRRGKKGGWDSSGGRDCLYGLSKKRCRAPVEKHSQQQRTRGLEDF